MSVILRWFHDRGERHRAFFRQSDCASGRELVIAGRDWEYTVQEPRAARLEDFSEATLINLARDCRTRGTAFGRGQSDVAAD
jgi:hypothetical protein